MRILFRADGNAKIGAGHVMRCLSIADAAKDKGIDCIFVCAGDDFKEKINSRGYKCIVLKTDYTQMNQETAQFLKQLKQYQPDIVFLDSYFVTDCYMREVKKENFLVYLDDIAAFDYPTDILIDYNAYSSSVNYEGLYAEKGEEPPVIIRGPWYAPLRSQFKGLSEFQLKDEAKKIFVSTGGSDPARLAIKIADYAIEHSYYHKYEFHFVISRFEEDYDEMKKNSEEYPFIRIHYDVSDMASLMRNCDMAISAAGSTLYELCACGLPTITYVLEDNQTAGEQYFLKNEIMLSAGDYRTSGNFVPNLFSLTGELSEDYELRRRLSEKAQDIVDGNGAEHIIDKIMKVYRT